MRVRTFPKLLAIGLVALVAAATARIDAQVALTTPAQIAPPAPAQSAAPAAAVRTVWDGVYTAEQAAKGQEIYRTICAECHSAGEAPNIVGRNFTRRWYDDNLNVPFSYMRRAMPDNAPGTLPTESYLDVLSYMLEAGGFPAGHEPLTDDAAKLTAIKVLDQNGQIPDMSMIQVVGCLANEGTAWTLTRGTRPTRARNPGDTPADALKAMAATPLGADAFQIQDILPQRRDLAGHKVVAKGILTRTPAGNRINLTAVQSLADSCTE